MKTRPVRKGVRLRLSLREVCVSLDAIERRRCLARIQRSMPGGGPALVRLLSYFCYHCCMSKERLTVTVDSELIQAANQAVAEKRVSSLSGWVNLALAERAAKERRLRALTEALAAYEAQFGEITLAEVEAQHRADRRNATTVRPRTRRKRT
jgi:hypothetical protein